MGTARGPAPGRAGSPSRSLREEKKASTRRQLTDAGVRRFLDQGYEATTLEEIADEVRISLRTLLRYFGSKEQLFHAWHHVALERFRTGLAERPAGESTLAFWRAWVARYGAMSARSEEFRTHRAMQERTPALHAHWLMILREYEDLLAGAFTDELGPDVELQARLLAIALVGGNEAATRRWRGSEGTVALAAACLEVVDETERLFRAAGVIQQH